VRATLRAANAAASERKGVWMSSKRQQTMAKLTRERLVKERRALKAEKKAAAAAAKAEAALHPDGLPTEDGEEVLEEADDGTVSTRDDERP
jgi:Cdc6-like AAA superfamily ATPase